jgi:arylformamidase
MVSSRYVFLSHPLTKTSPSYGNRDRFSSEATSQIKSGDSANSSRWFFSSNHIGSHVDMPKHFYDNGKTLTDYPANDWFFSEVQLVDIPRTEGTLIGPDDIMASLKPNIDLLLIRTGYERYREQEKYWNDNPGLKSEFAEFLKNSYLELRAVGFDFISLTSWRYRDVGKEAHRIFLEGSEGQSPIWIVEDLSLKSVSTDIFKVIIAPMLVVGENGSPVTVFAEVPN